ncbi:MAG: gliding motility-associated C-terminal domain-containing protein, partial [Bacteroidota bacterium]
TDTILNLPEGFYALTVVDVNGCITEVDTFLAQPDTLNAFITSMDISCFGEVDGIITVDSVIGGTPPFVYALDGVTFQPSGIFTGLPRGEYTITIEDVNGCSITRDAFIDEPFELSVFAGEDLFLELGDSAQLFGQINTTAPVSVSWEPPLYLDCVDCPDPTVRPFESVEYTFTAVDSNGCVATDDLLVDLRKIFDVYIPNAFSPNGDGVNDVFMIFGGKSVDVVLNFQVFDRWGERLYDARNFRTDDPRFGWDGTLSGRVMNPGVFVYFAEILYIDGTIVPVKGDVTLVR